MTSFPGMRGAVCAAAILSAGTAAADVTAAQVWADWQENLSLYGDDGLSVGAETMQGDTLTVSDIVLTIDDEFSDITATMGDLMFVENGDGTVTVQMAASYPIDIASDDGATVKMTVTQSGLVLNVSGTPDEMIYDLTADQYGISVGDIIEDGEKVDADFRMIANGLSGSYTSKAGDLRTVDYDLAAASLDILADAVSPEVPGDYFTFTGKVEGLGIKGHGTMPIGEAAEDAASLLVNGLGFDGGYSYRSGSYLFDVNSEGVQTSGTVRTGPGSMNAILTDTHVSYDTAVTDMNVAINSADIPFPIELSMAEYGIGLDMPLAKTQEPADFGLRVNLTDFSVNEVIWMMADPTGALPHDPATLLIDLSGKAKLFFDLIDPAQADAIAMADVPGELNALTLNNLSLKLGGAALTGLGDFTFDNTDLETFDGMPRPTGELTMNLKGGNALIDSLVKMGLIPEDQAMMGRMMMGMFARSVGDDELSSKIEINDQGHVIANGQRVQ
ncbi:MAG: DUF2125 domain-containing protein [Yoonia sp.]|nr:DUF2125 domain-containing protein [Yoonia sp.]